MNILSTAVPLWCFLVVIAAGTAAWRGAWWFTEQYEIGCDRKPARLWYGRHAHVCRAADQDSSAPDLFTVIDWAYDSRDGSPWVHAKTLYDDDPASFWAPVTEFAPCTVRKFRPHLVAGHSRPHLLLFRWQALPQQTQTVSADPGSRTH